MCTTTATAAAAALPMSLFKSLRYPEAADSVTMMTSSMSSSQHAMAYRGHAIDAGVHTDAEPTAGSVINRFDVERDVTDDCDGDVMVANPCMDGVADVVTQPAMPWGVFGPVFGPQYDRLLLSWVSAPVTRLLRHIRDHPRLILSDTVRVWVVLCLAAADMDRGASVHPPRPAGAQFHPRDDVADDDVISDVKAFRAGVDSLYRTALWGALGLPTASVSPRLATGMSFRRTRATDARGSSRGHGGGGGHVPHVEPAQERVFVASDKGMDVQSSASSDDVEEDDMVAGYVVHHHRHCRAACTSCRIV
jgi:hypothetical protein